MLGLLLVRLFDLQFNKGSDLLAKAQDFSRKELRLTGARGKIMDRDGLLLAYNETTYDVEFVKDPLLRSKDDRERYTKSIISAIDIIEKNGGKTISSFAIHKDKDGNFDFAWLGLNKVDDKESYDEQVKKFRSNMSTSTGGAVKRDAKPVDFYHQLRTYFFIPESFNDEQAYKVLSVWQEVKYSAYTINYIPVVLAEDVDMNTVAQIEIRSNELLGMQIGQGLTRVYPNQSMAAHIIGYTGRMLKEKTIVDNQQAGYSPDDIVGITGIEATQEYELSGNIGERTGTRVVEVDSQGKVIRELESDNKQPMPGNNVMLTIDSPMQKILEEALAKNVQDIRIEQEKLYNDPVKKATVYDPEIARRSGVINKPWPISYVTGGAAVVMDVHTGDILAMASNPSYDLNLFTGGISDKEFKNLTESTGDNPLFNKAIASRGTPGSVFKMVTGLAGLMEGKIAITDQITDLGPYTVYTKNKNDAPKCYVAPYYNRHANLNIVDALKVSCNYYFFTVADKLGVGLLNKWADMLGLSNKTGIELTGEVKSQIGNQDSLFNPDSSPGGVASLVYSQIKGFIKEICIDHKLEYSEPKYDAVVRELMKLPGVSDEMGPDIRATLKNELKLDAQVINQKNMSNQIALYLAQIKWNPNDTIATGIGQSVTMVTPIAMARYLSALVNGGEVYDAKLVKAIVSPEGKVRAKTPVLVRNLNAQEVYLKAIKDGMRKVVSDEDGGTAGKEFENFKYKDEIGGKTGTAQVSRIDLENNAWFVAFAPFEKPEIAVVVYIPNGYVGHLASYTAKEIIQYYMDKKQQTNMPDTLPAVNGLVR